MTPRPPPPAFPEPPIATMAYVQFALICLLFGSNFILMDRATRYFGPIEIGFGRLLGAAVVMTAVWLLWERKQRVRWADLRNIALVGLIGNAYPYTTQPMLIAQGFGHSFFGMMVAFTPLLTILASMPLLGVRPSKRQLVGVLVGLAFVFLLMYDGNLRGISPWLLLVAVTVPLSYAVSNTWLKKTLKDTPATPLGAIMMVCSLLMVLPLLLNQPAQAELGIGPPEPRNDFGVAMVAVLALGFFGTGACVWMFVRLVLDRGPLFAGMVTYVVPVVAMLWGLADSETITTRQIVAIVGTLSMVALVQAPEKPRAASKQEEWAQDPAIPEPATAEA